MWTISALSLISRSGKKRPGLGFTARPFFRSASARPKGKLSGTSREANLNFFARAKIRTAAPRSPFGGRKSAAASTSSTRPVSRQTRRARSTSRGLRATRVRPRVSNQTNGSGTGSLVA